MMYTEKIVGLRLNFHFEVTIIKVIWGTYSSCENKCRLLLNSTKDYWQNVGVHRIVFSSIFYIVHSHHLIK